MVTCFVAWLNSYSCMWERIWKFVPQKCRSFLVTLIIFIFGITVRGEWILIFVHLWRQFGFWSSSVDVASSTSAQEFSWANITLESLKLNGWLKYWAICNSFGFTVYFLVGGFLHWYFYMRQRDRPESWKCQPTKWLPPELELHCIAFGSLSLMATNTVSSLLACYIANGGRWSTVYYRLDQYSYSWYFLQWPVVFLYQDYTTYWMHRLFHTPTLYKMFHKAHHRYVQPTAFSVTAIHPVEIVSIQLILSLPLFTIPVHWTSFSCIAVYTYYNGIIDHSGIDFKAPWWQPWRPDTIFHDNHHQYFHVNFGFNCYFWDLLHGTYRRTDRIYKEDIFYGKGKPMYEATKKEIEEEVEMRKTENLNAHRRINPLLLQDSKEPSRQSSFLAAFTSGRI